jgi:hypothetical protein
MISVPVIAAGAAGAAAAGAVCAAEAVVEAAAGCDVDVKPDVLATNPS